MSCCFYCIVHVIFCIRVLCYLVEFGGEWIGRFLPLRVAHSGQQTELELVLFGAGLVLGCELHEGDGVVGLHCHVTLL